MFHFSIQRGACKLLRHVALVVFAVTLRELAATLVADDNWLGDELSASGHVVRPLQGRQGSASEEAVNKNKTVLEPTTEGREEKSETDSCCNCPALDVEHVEKTYGIIRDGFESVVPGKWFLLDGSLIGALRYGDSVHRFKSGKVNLVDIDVDVGVICPEEEVEETEKKLKDAFPSWWKKGPVGRLITECHMPATGCTKKGKPLHFAIRWIYESDGGKHLSLEKGGEEGNDDIVPMKPANRFDFLKVIGPSLHDHLLPLIKVKWGGGDAWAPHHYFRHLALGNNEEYGHDDGWMKLPMPDRMSPYCDCEVDEASEREVNESISALHRAGYGSFYGISVEGTKKDIKDYVAKYEKAKGGDVTPGGGGGRGAR